MRGIPEHKQVHSEQWEDFLYSCNLYKLISFKMLPCESNLNWEKCNNVPIKVPVLWKTAIYRSENILRQGCTYLFLEGQCPVCLQHTCLEVSTESEEISCRTMAIHMNMFGHPGLKINAKCKVLSGAFRLTPCCSLVGVLFACPDIDRTVLAGWRAEVVAQQVSSGIVAWPRGIRCPSWMGVIK